MIEKLPGWLVGVGMVIGGGLVGVWWAFTFIPHQGVKENLADKVTIVITFDLFLAIFIWISFPFVLQTKTKYSIVPQHGWIGHWAKLETKNLRMLHACHLHNAERNIFYTGSLSFFFRNLSFNIV